MGFFDIEVVLPEEELVERARQRARVKPCPKGRHVLSPSDQERLTREGGGYAFCGRCRRLIPTADVRGMVERLQRRSR